MRFLYNLAVLVLISLMFFNPTNNVFSQVSTYQSVRKIGNDGFSYLDKNISRCGYTKDDGIKIVFSDRDDNVAYLDPYGQKKSKSQKILTPYFVLSERNGFFELVVADSSLIGKPKGMFSFLMNKKYHFTDTKSLNYAGWISQDNILKYSKSFTDVTNNRPLKYKVGLHKLKSLFQINKNFNKDSLYVYKDPSFKVKSNKMLLANQTVYPYKYDVTGKAVLVSTKPSIKDTISQISGWVPSDLIIPIGQNEVFKLDDDASFQFINENCDTIVFRNRDIYSKYLYRNHNHSIRDDHSLINVTFPLYVWNHRENTLTNVKGNDFLVSEVDKISEGNKNINFHFIFNSDKKDVIKPLINSFQKNWVELSQNLNFKLTFSAICTGKKSYVLPPTTSFVKWLDFMQFISSESTELKAEKKLNIPSAVSYILSKNNSGRYSFENNFFVVIGSNEQFNLYEDSKLVRKIAERSSKFLFVQLNNTSDDDSQNFILKSKASLNKIGEHYNSFIENYIVDNGLLVKVNSFKNLNSDSDNIYIYDAPDNSLFNGGVIFPKLNQQLSPSSLNIAIDSVLVNMHKTNQKLVKSLNIHKNKLGLLRSLPSYIIQQYFNADELAHTKSLSHIDRNNASETFYKSIELDKKITDSFENGYILTTEELKMLIENYRILFPYFKDGLNEENRKVLKKMFKFQIEGINNSFMRRVLNKRSTIAELVFYKTGLPVVNNELDKFIINCITCDYAEENQLPKLYKKLFMKISILEEKLLANELEKTKDESYFIPKRLLL